MSSGKDEGSGKKENDYIHEDMTCFILRMVRDI